VQGGVLLKGPYWDKLAQQFPIFGKVNNGTLPPHTTTMAIPSSNCPSNCVS
jgi:hypothetical protein